MIDSFIENIPGDCQDGERRNIQGQKQKEENRTRDYESLWNEINESLASNSFINNEDHTEKIKETDEDELDIWATPRASWHTTCDGYIEAWQIDKTLGLTDIYSKINRNQNYDKILTSQGRDTDIDVITYNSHVTLSYTNTKVMITPTPMLLEI